MPFSSLQRAQNEGHFMLQRLLHGHRTPYVLTAIVLGTCIAAPLPAHSHVCLPRYGCPRVQPPRLTSAVAIRVVQGYLAQNPPVVRFRLQKPIGAQPPPGYQDLARAGLLRIVSGADGQEPGPVFGLPENWKREIMSGFFRFSQVQTDDGIGYFIEIPVGHLRYVPGSAVLTRPKDTASPSPITQARRQI